MVVGKTYGVRVRLIDVAAALKASICNMHTSFMHTLQYKACNSMVQVTHASMTLKHSMDATSRFMARGLGAVPQNERQTVHADHEYEFKPEAYSVLRNSVLLGC